PGAHRRDHAAARGQGAGAERMKRAFDSNVSKARPRTRTATAVEEREAPLSRDLAAAIVGRRGKPDARRAQAFADAAGAAAAQVTRKDEPKRKDGLVHTEESLAEQAAASAHATARAGEPVQRKEGLARAMRM